MYVKSCTIIETIVITGFENYIQVRKIGKEYTIHVYRHPAQVIANGTLRLNRLFNNNNRYIRKKMSTQTKDVNVI